MGEPADASDHRVDSAAGGALQKFLEFLAEVQAQLFRRYGSSDKHERGRHSVDFGEQGAGPCRSLGRDNAHGRLDREGDPEFGRERRQPVVPVREHEDLAVIAGLEELLGAAMQEPDSGIGPGDDVVLQVERELKGTVLSRVEVTEIEDEIGVEVTGCPEGDEDLA